MKSDLTNEMLEEIHLGTKLKADLLNFYRKFV